jgi:hypothetical protein
VSFFFWLILRFGTTGGTIFISNANIPTIPYTAPQIPAQWTTIPDASELYEALEVPRFPLSFLFFSLFPFTPKKI